MKRSKFMSRADIRRWLDPIRKCFIQMRRGYVDSINGYPVTQLGWDDEWARIDLCIAGWREAVARMVPDTDMLPMIRLEKKLANGVMLTHKEIDDGLAFLNQYESKLIRVPREKIRDAVNAQLIAIEVERLGLSTGSAEQEKGCAA